MNIGKIWYKHKVFIVFIPTIVGLHYFWYKIQKNPLFSNPDFPLKFAGITITSDSPTEKRDS